MSTETPSPAHVATADFRRRVLLGLVGVVIVVIVVIVVVFSIPDEEKRDSNVASGHAPKKAPEAGLDPPRVTFTDVTDEWGLDFRHENGAAGEKLLPETMGSGAAFFDYDGDGDPDLFCVNSDWWPHEKYEGARPTQKLYRNDGGRFTDVTREAGLAQSFYGMGTAVGDFDGDGRPDLFVTAVGANRLYRNVDGKRFEDVTDKAGVGGGDRWSTSAVFLDHDDDGDADLFVLNYIVWSRKIDLEQGFSLVGLGRAYGPPEGFEGESCTLFENRGDGTFEDVSAPAGVVVKNQATGVPAAKSLGVVVCHLNDDRLPDLVVANDTVRNFAFLNRGGGRFAEVGEGIAVAHDSAGNARGAMGIAVADYRNDGATAIAIGNFANEMTALYVNENPSDILFIDEAPNAGIGAPTRNSLTFGLVFLDYDLDGRADLMAANGHVEPDINRVQESQRHAQPIDLFWNAGAARAGYFVAVGPEQAGEDIFRPVVGRGLAVADIDVDGDLDVLLTVNDGRARLLRNDGSGNRSLRLRLLHEGSLDAVVGATVSLTTSAGRQTQSLGGVGGYLTTSERVLTFGLGADEAATDVVVRWPDGSERRVPRLTPGAHEFRYPK